MVKLGKKINLKQDIDQSKQVLIEVEKIFTDGEKHLSLAIQKKPIINILPHAIIVTNKRIIKYQPRILGTVFVDYLWKDLKDVHLRETIFGGHLNFTFELGNIIITHIPKDQAKEIYRIAQEREEEWCEKKRHRHLEETRAKSGANHILVNGSQNNSSNTDLRTKLLELKELLKDDIITQ
ncbi:MAG: PH domain-containing protein, partial [Candidatus Aenigmarchaeota archaeon]|nr:PH domain-containing protein [Candidatus Aenigmarchaeota archaeon]